MSRSLPTLSGRRQDVMPAREQLERLDALQLRPFEQQLEQLGLWPLHPVQPKVLQLNLGKLCNQRCTHCHVDAGPERTEVMTRETMAACLTALESTDIETVDITGGAPELVPGYRWLVEECRRLGRHVITRCNLTVADTKKHSDLPDFFAKNQVEVVASLPHYRQLNTDKQRGDGVFEKSIAVMQRLCAAGYGQEGSGLRLVLVTNPVGAFLPASQASLESEWKRELQSRYGIDFNALFTITNMPISRYLEWLLQSQNLEEYMSQLVNAFNPHAAKNLMCRDTISVGWEGTLYDCDFNQMLELGLSPDAPRRIESLDVKLLMERAIRVGPHCYGCTAGAGSSCGGAVVKE